MEWDSPNKKLDVQYLEDLIIYGTVYNNNTIIHKYFKIII